MTYLSLFSLIFPIGFWIGIVVLARAGKTRAWWCMIAGNALLTLSIFFNLVPALLHALVSAGFRSSEIFWVLLPMLTNFCGTLLLTAGFVMHALATVRLALRAAELEQLSQAMAAQINSQSSGRPF